MKKLLIITLSIMFAMIGTAFILPYIKQVQTLPDNMIITYEDIEKANNTNEYSSLINLSLPENINVATNSDLTETTLTVKLFNLFTIKKVNVRLLVDTDVFVGGETVGFNLFSEGVICVGSNTVVTENGIQEPIKATALQDGDAIIKIEDIAMINARSTTAIPFTKEKEQQ